MSLISLGLVAGLEAERLKIDGAILQLKETQSSLEAERATEVQKVRDELAQKDPW